MRDYNLIDYKALQSKEKRKPKDERELLARLRVFARYQSPQEHEQFAQGVLEAKRLRKRIEQLQQYRRLGIRTQAEAMQYESEKRKREQEQQMRRQRDSASYLYDARPAGTQTSGKDRSSRYKKRQRDSSDVDGKGVRASVCCLALALAEGVSLGLDQVGVLTYHTHTHTCMYTRRTAGLLAGLEDESLGGAGLGGGGGGKSNLPPGVPGAFSFPSAGRCGVV